MLTLEAQPRDLKMSPSYLRKMRKIPAVYYGHKEKPLSLQIEYQPFRKAYIDAGGNQVIELLVDGKKKPVLIHDVQFHPLTSEFTHIDFMHVDMSEKVKARIPVEIIGLAPAVKDFGGIMSTMKHEIEVKSLPGDLPKSIQVDVSVLKQLHSAIHIKDLNLGDKIEILDEPESVIVTVVPMKVEVEEPKAAEVAVAPTEAALAEGAKPAAEAASGKAEGDKKK